MSREILFRGKHIHVAHKNEHPGGRWIEGYLSDKNYINSPELEGEFLVDSETVCQYTGLTDKNGRKIFEGDILKRVLLPTKRIKNNFRFAFVSANSCFSAIDLDGRKVTFISDYINSSYEIEVIGNIFDNPELLE